MSTASPTVSAGNSGAPRGSLQKLLEELDACNEARVWALQFTTLAEAWKACKRGDWMVFLAAKKAGEPGWPTRQEVVLATCACAARALPLCRPEHRRIARNTLAVTRRWARGEATDMEVKTAANAVAACEAAITYRAPYSRSAIAAIRAAGYAASYGTPVYTVVAAADAVVGTRTVRRDASLAASAKICRRMLKIPVEVRS